MATKTTSDLPKSVKVAWRDYKIENWDRREAAGAGRYGETVHASKTIKIDMSYGSRQAASTLLHEIMHASAAMWNYQESSKEEEVVSAFQHGLSTVWRDNPDVFAWIGHHLVHGS